MELTSRCNLRCVYCAVSQPTYVGSDMEVADFDTLVQELKARRVRALVVNGHGETTMIPGWHSLILKLAHAGFCMSIISNFAWLLSDEELAAMARTANIQVSLDTHRPEVLRETRLCVDLGNILTNMQRVRSTASKLGIPQPQFAWSCVVNDHVALDLVDYIHFGLACGVRDFTLYNMTKYDDVPGGENVNHVTTMSRDKLEQFARLLQEAETLVKNVGGNFHIQSGLPNSVHAKLAEREVA